MVFIPRALSFAGVEYDVLEHKLTPDQVEIYDTFAKAFRIIHQNLHKALEATGITNSEEGVTAASTKSNHMSRFESTKQRFFNHLPEG